MTRNGRRVSANGADNTDKADNADNADKATTGCRMHAWSISYSCTNYGCRDRCIRISQDWSGAVRAYNVSARLQGFQDARPGKRRFYLFLFC